MQYLLWAASTSDETVLVENSYPCQNWLISRDGVFFENGPRKLWESPYYNSVIIPPGSRAEFLVICNEAGSFSYWADDDTRGTALDNAPVPTEKQLILKLEVSGSYSGDLEDTCSDWGAPELPCTPQPYLPHSPYLTSTLDKEYPDVTSNCSSNHSANELSQCSMVFRRNKVFQFSEVSINGIEFNTSRGMFKIPSGVTYEWLITSNFHPMHHHTWPYQVQLDLGKDGWIAHAGDWRDTLGAPGSYRVRTNMYDYLEGKLVMHCHFVPHEDHGMMTWHQLGGYEDGTYMIPNETDADGKFSVASNENRYTQCEELYGVSLIDSWDVETLFLTGVRIFNYGGDCYLGIFNLVDLRNAGVENFWVGLGFGGDYAHGDDTDSSNMEGNALIWSLQATDNGPFDDMGYAEIELKGSTVDVVKKSKTEMSCGDYYSRSIDGLNYAYWFCVRPLTTTFFGDKIHYDNKLGYIWSYGEGRYTKYNMHAARGGCRFEYNPVINNWDEINATVCIHYENEIAVSNGQNNQKVKTIFANITFPPLNASEWIIRSGYDEAVEDAEEELAAWIIVIICVSVLVVILIIYIVWRYKLKDKKDGQSDKTMMQVDATSGQSSAQPSGQPSGQSTPK